MPSSPAPTAPAAIPGSRTVRTGIVLLAAVGFALSYDALRQMAVAVHIRGLLTYLFPLVIDGFIAIGVVALITLRTAPLRSRLYVWVLVGAATITSIWANAVHAIRLNEGTRLYLDNATVGALSAIAPLALAGAVHLYLVINRHLAANNAVAEPPPANAPDKTAAPKSNRQARPEPSPASTVPSGKTSDALKPEAQAPTVRDPRPHRRQSTVPKAELLATARAIGAKTGKVPRTALEKKIRAKGYTIRKDLAQEAANTVMAELDSANGQDNAAA